MEKFLASGKGIVVYHLALVFSKRTKTAETIIDESMIVPCPDMILSANLKSRLSRRSSDREIAPTSRFLTNSYTCFAVGGRPIEVLAEATSVNVKKAFPMAYLHKFGKGYAFTTVLGHDLRALKSQEFVTMLRNAVLWLGHKEVPPAPAKVVSPSKPIIEGRYYPVVQEELNARIRQIQQRLNQGEKLLVYADCGRVGQDRSIGRMVSSKEFVSLSFATYSNRNCSRLYVSRNPARLEVEGLRPGRMQPFISWWTSTTANSISPTRVQTETNLSVLG
jgi:hypothetical protein